MLLGGGGNPGSPCGLTSWRWDHYHPPEIQVPDEAVSSLALIRPSLMLSGRGVGVLGRPRHLVTARQGKLQAPLGL